VRKRPPSGEVRYQRPTGAGFADDRELCVSVRTDSAELPEAFVIEEIFWLRLISLLVYAAE
jgi:hypothetical protein